MARPPRIQYPGALYHVTSRGNAQQLIFEGRPDYETFLATLELVVARYRWRCHTYCLLGNHYHLLLETPEPNLALGMRQLNGTYAQAFNRPRGRVGHVFQGRYGAVLVESERHLLQLSRYVALNPVRARLCRRPAEWPWSSYRAMIGAAPAPALLRVRLAAQRFRGEAGRCPETLPALRRGRKYPDRHGANCGADLSGQPGVRRGGKRTSPASPEMPMAQRRPIRPELADLLSRGDGAEIVVAHRQHGYRLNEIRVARGAYATVQRRLQAWEDGRPMLQRKT